MHELRRHAPLGRTRRLPSRDRARGLHHLYAGRQRGPTIDLYMTDKAEARRGNRFRWFFSTCLAATVGAIAITAVIFGSIDPNEGRGGVLPMLRNASQQAGKEARTPPRDGLKWAAQKADRLHAASGSMTTRYIVQETVQQRRGNREYTQNRPYARIVARLAAVPVLAGAEIPVFNPFRLYASTQAQGDEGASEQQAERGDVKIRIIELLGTTLPTDDGQELDSREIMDIVRRSASAPAEDAAMRPTFLPEGAEIALPSQSRLSKTSRTADRAPYTTDVEKTSTDLDEVAEEAEGQQVKVKIGRNETLTRLLVRMGAETWQARQMVDAARSIMPESAITPSHDIEVTVAPSLTQSGKSEPVRLAILSESGEHKLSVHRNSAGEFTASAERFEPSRSRTRAPEDGDQNLATTLYLGIYHAGLAQKIPPESIEQILRVHAYDVDYRRRPRGSDAVEFFFDLKEEERGAESTLGELLYTSVSIAGDAQRYYRFRTSDGLVDYYDEAGNNSRKFLMRRPVRSEDVRLVSGFGLRFHPLLNSRRMHTGVDWAGPIGLPIIASGNGMIEEIGPKGQYGNYVRIRHANGYQTAYGHMSRFGAGMRVGVRVRQGDTIGYIGNTGLSTGPHVHYEVLVGNRYVDPMSIQVPRERKLAGKILLDFQRERGRIDDLMRRPPVLVQ